MKIAFVGKGGSGKSTLTASFAAYLADHTEKQVAVFDADLNIHVPELLGFESVSAKKHLSHPDVQKNIRRWLIGDNDIQNLNVFRKTTPPTRKSNLVHIEQLSKTPLADLAVQRDNLSVFVVGTYQEYDIGAGCYHNNLSILESLLNHTDDLNGYVAVDMVAGVDSFAGTLHAQFDLTCFVVEPTKRSVEVYKKYKDLATEAGVQCNLLVIVNKIQSDKDKEFIAKHIPEEDILGYFAEDEYVRHIDQVEEPIDTKKLLPQNQELLSTIVQKVNSLPDIRDERLKKLWELHRKYVQQPFITERFGDLTNQIDPTFSYCQAKT